MKINYYFDKGWPLHGGWVRKGDKLRPLDVAVVLRDWVSDSKDILRPMGKHTLKRY
jgi:hypothetical protein